MDVVILVYIPVVKCFTCEHQNGLEESKSKIRKCIILSKKDVETHTEGHDKDDNHGAQLDHNVENLKEHDDENSIERVEFEVSEKVECGGCKQN